MDTLTAKRNDDFRKSVMRGLKSKDGKAIFFKKLAGRCRSRKFNKCLSTSRNCRFLYLHRRQRPTR